MRAALRDGAAMVALIAGGGKTRVVVEHACEIGARLVAVVAPAIAVTGVWPVEIARWWPEASIVLLRDLRAGAALPDGPTFVITSPDLLVASAEARKIALSLPIDLLLIDEAQQEKNPAAARTRFIYGQLAPRCRRTIAMSGTFVLNHAGELYSHLSALAPQRVAAYRDYGSFCRKFCTYGLRRVPGRAQPLEVITGSNTAAFPELRKMLAGVMFRLPRAEVEAGLPPLRIRKVPLALDPVDAEVISDLEHSPEAEQLREAITTGDLRGVDGHLSRIRRLLALTKAGAAAAWAEAALAEGEPAVLIFGWHVEALEQTHARLAHHGAALITGSTPAKQRDAAVRRLQAGEIKALVGQIGAAGVAITATAARRVIFTEMAWTPALNEQALKRAHRTGQRQPVLVDMLTVPDSIDNAVVGLLAKKMTEIAELEEAAA
jgi:SNF2 family DNA or RNA helicase